MGLEIERKFLLMNDSWRKDAGEGLQIIQAYLSLDKARNVRVRLYGEQGFLTIKGKTEGISRVEFEYPIPKDDVLALLPLCLGAAIEKKRYLLNKGNVTWEIDEFFGANRGLFLAEVELESEDQALELPDWVGEEVSSDPRYFNSSLAQNPMGIN